MGRRGSGCRTFVLEVWQHEGRGKSGNQAAELRGRWLYFIRGGVFMKAANGGKSWDCQDARQADSKGAECRASS